jgi:hypothetical protein
MDPELCADIGSFCRNPYYNGCYKRCPCEWSSNCSYYIDPDKKDERIGEKDYSYAEEWYSIYFRCDYCAGDFEGSG